jgi:cyclic beta-1,2-glucan synthetase
MWPTYSLDWRHGGSRYHIVVQNPSHQYRGVRSAVLDGVDVDPRAIPLRDDGGNHEVIVVLGSREDSGVPLANAERGQPEVPPMRRGSGGAWQGSKE